MQRSRTIAECRKQKNQKSTAQILINKIKECGITHFWIANQLSTRRDAGRLLLDHAKQSNAVESLHR